MTQTLLDEDKRKRLRQHYRDCVTATLALWDAERRIEREIDMDLDFLRDCIDDVCAGLDTAEQLTDDMLDQLIDDTTTENDQ